MPKDNSVYVHCDKCDTAYFTTIYSGQYNRGYCEKCGEKFEPIKRKTRPNERTISKDDQVPKVNH
jgi:hypothetical protein